MKKKIFLIALGLLIVPILYLTLFHMKPASLPESTKMEFSKDDFVDAMLLSDKNALVAENDNFELYLDQTTSYFKVVNKDTGVEWNSNPTKMDPQQFNMTTSAIEKQKATLEISYFNEEGSLAQINNYRKSISHPESVLFAEGLRTFSIKNTESGFQVLYNLKSVDIDYLYFPKYLKPEIVDAHPQRVLIKSIYDKFDTDLGVYAIGKYEELSVLSRKDLYPIFYGEYSLNYTRERAIAENESYGYYSEYNPIEFEIAIDVRLTEKGVKVSVIQDSIVESEVAKLASVSVFPHFGTAISVEDNLPTEGYIVLPDGSGAVIEFNNGKSYQQPYSKRLYGEDLGAMSYKMPEAQQKISIPLYGMVKEDSGFAAIITEGDTMATINADVSGRIDSYNKVYPTFNFRENEAIILGSGFNQYAIDLWTEERVACDFSVDYYFLNQEEASYVGIAGVYRKYLEDNFNFDNIDSTNKTQLMLEILGAYQKKDFFLGVPYYTKESLTSFEETILILEELKNYGINNIDIMYKGMMNGGLTQEIGNNFKIESVLGGKSDYQNLMDYSQTNDIAIHPSLSIMITNQYDRPFDEYRYNSFRIDGKLSLNFTYHLPSKLPYSETTYAEYKDKYVVSPLFLEEVLNDFLDKYPYDNISFEYLGSALGGSYGDTVVYKEDALKIQKSLLEKTEKDILLSNPLGFALAYADLIQDLPLDTTRYAIIDYQIPLLQLIIAGKVDYSTISLNLANERTTQYNFLKVIETGSNLKYTVSYNSSIVLKDTEYNNYFSTEYTNWIEQINKQVTELDNIGLHEGYLVEHEKVDNNIFRVKYSNGLEILINYNLTEAKDILGYDIPGQDYVVMGGNN